jgi:ribA/ribD-fused uncharacterized protein
MQQNFGAIFMQLRVPATKFKFPSHADANLENSFQHVLPFYSHSKHTEKEVSSALANFWSTKKVDTRIFSNLYVAPILVKFRRIVDDDYVEVERKECDKDGNEKWESNEHYFQCAKYGPGDRVFMRDLTTGQVASYGQRRMKFEKNKIERINMLKNAKKPIPLKKNNEEYKRDDVSEPQISLKGGPNEWDREKISIMYDAIRAKFSDQIPELKEQLMATENAWLVEHTRNDKQWADGATGVGMNYLGKLLMFRREEIRQEEEGYDADAWYQYVCYDENTKEFLKCPMSELLEY